MNIQKFASRFLIIFASADDEKKLKLLKILDSLSRADSDFEQIKVELFNTEPDVWSHLFAIVKKNPSISLSQFVTEKEKLLKEKEKKEQNKISQFTPEEQQAVQHIANSTIKDWAIKSLKLCEILRKEPERLHEIIESLNVIIHFKEENNIDLHSKYSGKNGFLEAIKDAVEWEESFKNVKTSGYVTNVIVWSNESWNIVEIKGEEEAVENDLKLEGKIMNHCVGGYTDHVMQGSSRIFSLRDKSNHPHATIETDSEIYKFKQVYGPGNRELDSDKFSIIKAWQNTIHPKEKIFGMVTSDNAENKINAVNFIDFKESEYSGLLDNLLQDKSETTSSHSYSNESTSVLEALAENETLPQEKYLEIYKTSLKDAVNDEESCLKTIARLARNSAISNELFRNIFNDNNSLKSEDIEIAIMSSRKLKDNLDIVNDLFKSTSYRLINILLNNPSVPSRTCIDFLVKDNFKIILSLEGEENLEPKFIDDVISACKVLDITLGVIRLLNNNISKINKESLFKLFNAKGIEYNKSENISDLLGNLLIKKYNLSNKYEAKLLSVSTNDLLSSNPYTPASILAELSKSKNSFMKGKLAENPSTPVQILIDLSQDEDAVVKFRAMSNPNFPTDILIEKYKNMFFKDGPRKGQKRLMAYSIMGIIASNPKAPPQILAELSDEEDSVKVLVASNPNTPGHVLDKLLKDESANKEYILTIKRNIALNPNTPSHVLEQLSKTTNSGIREYVAKNPNTPIKILLELLQNAFGISVAANSSLPVNILEKLSQDEDLHVRWHVASNPNTPPYILEKLYKNDGDSINMLEFIAGNKNTPVKILEELSRYENIAIKLSVARNVNTPIPILEKLSSESVYDIGYEATTTLIELHKATNQTPTTAMRLYNECTHFLKLSTKKNTNIVKLLKICSAFFKKSEEVFDPRKERPIDPSLLEKEIVDIVKEYDYDEDDNLSTINKMYSGQIEYDHTADVKIQELHKKICDVWPEYQNRLKEASEYVLASRTDRSTNPRINESDNDIKDLFTNGEFNESNAKKVSLYIAEWLADFWVKCKVAQTIVDYKVNFSCNTNFLSHLNEKKDKKFLSEWLAEIFNSILYSLRVNENSFKTGKDIIHNSCAEHIFTFLRDCDRYENEEEDEKNHRGRLRYLYDYSVNFIYFCPSNVHNLQSLLSRIQKDRSNIGKFFRTVEEKPFTGKDPFVDSFNKNALNLFHERLLGDKVTADKFFKEFLKINNKYEILQIIADIDFEPNHLINLLNKINLLTLNNFILFIQTLKITDEDAMTTASSLIDFLQNQGVKVIKNQSSFINDLKIFNKIYSIVHNNSKDDTSLELWAAIYNNVNLNNISTNIIEKFIEAIIILDNFESRNKTDIIQACIKNKLISNNFYENIKAVKSIFEKNIKLPISDEALKKIINTVKTEIEIVLNSESIVEYSEIAAPKNEKLFELDSEIIDGTNKLRFRVLKDKDPYHFTVGLDTDCCQRIGGFGEAAAIDSYVNDQAGVLLLELNSDNEWNIISQSYFHYVPEDNGVILDNVESNDNNIEKFNIDINKIYSDYAIDMKNKLNLAYFKCGKAYNALDNSLFKTDKMKSDPRYFAVSDPYSDFKNYDHIDLTQKNK